MNSVKVDELDHVAIRVDDVEASARWYCDVLGLERRLDDSSEGGPLMVGVGAASIALFPATSKLSKSDRRLAHIAFRTDRAGFDRACDALAERDIGGDLVDHGISESIYFRDPDDNVVEITTYDV